MLTQQNQAWMVEQGNCGLCNFCNYGFTGMGDSGQTVRITNIVGSVISITPPLYIAYNLSPVAFRYTQTLIQGAGLEYLKIKGNNTGYKEMIMMQGNYGSWVKGVEVDFADNAHIFLYNDLNCEIRDSIFHDGFNHGPGGTDNQLNLAYWTSNTLVENNIFWRQHTSVMFERGSSGNVVAYNFMTGDYHTAGTEQWEIMDIDWHGTHPMFNLLEGNENDTTVIDDFWGSSSHTTFFRDYSTGSRLFLPPRDARGALVASGGVRPSCIGTNSTSCWEDGFSANSGNSFGLDINELSTNDNVVGYITGSTHLVTGNSGAATKISPTATVFANFVCNRYGYDGSNDVVGHTAGYFASNKTNTSMFRHGVNDCTTNAITWDAGHPVHTLPASFYRNSKPSFFGASPWPGIGPDITGAAGWGGFVNSNPAHQCFNAATNNGTINTGTFDPLTCYAAVASAPIVSLNPLSLTFRYRKIKISCSA
jgi:hypothetical protein